MTLINPFGTWCIVELRSGRRLAGHGEHCRRKKWSFLRLTVPSTEDGPYTQAHPARIMEIPMRRIETISEASEQEARAWADIYRWADAARDDVRVRVTPVVRQSLRPVADPIDCAGLDAAPGQTGEIQVSPLSIWAMGDVVSSLRVALANQELRSTWGENARAAMQAALCIYASRSGMTMRLTHTAQSCLRSSPVHEDYEKLYSTLRLTPSGCAATSLARNALLDLLGRLAPYVVDAAEELPPFGHPPVEDEMPTNARILEETEEVNLDPLAPNDTLKVHTPTEEILSVITSLGTSGKLCSPEELLEESGADKDSMRMALEELLRWGLAVQTDAGWWALATEIAEAREGDAIQVTIRPAPLPQRPPTTRDLAHGPTDDVLRILQYLRTFPASGIHDVAFHVSLPHHQTEAILHTLLAWDWAEASDNLQSWRLGPQCPWRA